MTPPCKHCGKRRGEHLSSPLWCPETRAGVQYAPADYFHGMRRAMEIAERISEPRRSWDYPSVRVAPINELKEAVEKELADG